MSSIRYATKTLAAIEEMVARDQGATYRGWLGKVMPHIADAYRTDEDGHRSHMGASLIGGECARSIWYNFRWATKSNFGGRLLRLFNRGHMEEGRFISMLLGIGCTIYQQDENGEQFRISHADGHFGGSGDGVCEGCPDVPDQPVLLEFKTSGDKPFQELVKKGVRDAKFEHYVQMNIYMHKMGLAVALYMVVNKNNDELYGEIVTYDRAVAEQFLERGSLLIASDTPPEKLSESPGFWKCRFCDHKEVCHLSRAPDRNCRTCAHSVTAEAGSWRCTYHDKTLSKEEQLAACGQYELHRGFD